VVDHVGVSERAPLAGLNLRLPGSDPTPASAGAAVVIAAPAITPITPIAPRRTRARRIVVTVRHLALAARRAPEPI
jgi:hypothetical protein